MTPSSRDNGPGYQSLQRGLTMLELVQEHGRLRIVELSAMLEIPLSTVYRYAAVLAKSGFVHEVDGYLVASERLAESGGTSPHLIQIASPMLTWLRKETLMSAVLTVRVRTSALCLDVSYAHPRHRISYVRGTAMSLHAGASALPLLAYAPVSVLREVLAGEMRAFTAATLPADELEPQLRVIRATGFAVSRSQVTPGMMAIGVPVLVDGGCLCALSLVGKDSHRTPPTVFVDKLKAASAQLTETMNMIRDDTLNDFWVGDND